MSMFRTDVVVEVLRGPFVRSGEFDDGKPWSVREVEVFEPTGKNKTSLRVEDQGVADAFGRFVGKLAKLTVDVATKGRAKCVVVAVGDPAVKP